MKSAPLYRRQLKLLLIVWAIICGLLGLQLLTTEIFEPEVYNLANLIIPPSIRFIVGGVIIIIFVIPIYNFLKSLPKFWVKILGLIVAGLIASIMISFLNRSANAFIAGVLDFESIWKDTRQEIIFGLYHNVTYFLVFISVLFAIDYFQAKIEAIKKEKQMAQELTETKLSILQNQLQPHFLFNALNGISSVMDEGKDAAQDMVADLSDLLRNSLDTDFSEKITLGEELKILDSYLNIEQKRFENQLVIQRKFDDAVLNTQVPPFLLQPLVENAIKHGYKEGVESIEVRISGVKEDGQLVILVINNGRSLNNTDPGIGLNNLSERLKNSFGNEASFSLEQDGDWVVNKIGIPL